MKIAGFILPLVAAHYCYHAAERGIAGMPDVNFRSDLAFSGFAFSIGIWLSLLITWRWIWRSEWGRLAGAAFSLLALLCFTAGVFVLIVAFLKYF